MKWLRSVLDQIEPQVVKGGKFEKFFPLYEAIDTFLYTPGTTTHGPCHVRDSIDQKRMMGTVAVALIPCIFMAFFNTGYQANGVLQQMGVGTVAGWRGEILALLGLEISPDSWLSNLVHGGLYFIPVFLVCNIVGGLWEGLFATVRKHEINEGFLVTGILFPLTLPPTIPLWQVALGISFGVVLGKEVFGGTGRNFLNPALTARAFLFFAYPAEITGDSVWVAVDGFSGATPLGMVAADGMRPILEVYQWKNAFLGLIPGSMGETSALACIIGAVILIASGVGSWRTMGGVLVGMVVTIGLLHGMGSASNPAFSMPIGWHLVVGGFAFGMVFMATDPVSSAMTFRGRWAYGILIGVMIALIRVVNPAFPEGTMLAILFGNIFAPLIDHFVVQANVRRRELRCAK